MKIYMVVLLWLLVASCHAETTKTAATNKNDFLAFGTALLGQTPSDIKGVVSASDSCFISEDGSYIDCEYTDQQGISYLVEGSLIIRKEIRLPNRLKAELPLDFSQDDSLSEVIQKIDNSEGEQLVWHVVFASGDIIINTGFATKNVIGQERDFYIVFDDQGKMKLIGERINW